MTDSDPMRAFEQRLMSLHFILLAPHNARSDWKICHWLSGAKTGSKEGSGGKDSREESEF